MNNHTTAPRGKRIHIILKDGKIFKDKLLESRSKYFVFKNNGRIFRNNIRSFSISR
jgi:hypothetical protein